MTAQFRTDAVQISIHLTMSSYEFIIRRARYQRQVVLAGQGIIALEGISVAHYMIHCRYRGAAWAGRSSGCPRVGFR